MHQAGRRQRASVSPRAFGHVVVGSCCRKQDITGIQSPVVKQSPLSCLGEWCEGWPGTGSCQMAQASLPCLPWAGALGAALASCSVPFVLCHWQLLIVPEDPALINMAPISLLPRLSLTLEQSPVLVCTGWKRGVCCSSARPWSILWSSTSTQSGAGSASSACCLCLEGKG